MIIDLHASSDPRGGSTAASFGLLFPRNSLPDLLPELDRHSIPYKYTSNVGGTSVTVTDPESNRVWIKVALPRSGKAENQNAS